MCGIAGFIDPHDSSIEAQRDLATMLERIAYRGPDDEGMWFDGPMAIGHRRLSIVDLSPTGHQPMTSLSGRFVIALNGEIYNHERLRKNLAADGVVFRGRSDTEVLVELVERHGLKEALRQCIGMFAFALWDRQERTLRLARDRFGEKPLYYGWHRGRFLWGSELKALTAHTSFQGELDFTAISLFLRYGYIPSPYTIYRNTWKLPPASVLTLALPRSIARTPSPAYCAQRVETYWSSLDTALHAEPFVGTFEDATNSLEALLNDAVELQMRSDVPLGAFLSGGIDSSTVVALMQKRASRPVRTFCVGFEEREFDETRHANAVARHLGTDHTDLRVDAASALQVIPCLPHMYDEPLGDPSQIPTFLVARLARRTVTVSLSGDGGDEIFGGYRKYVLGLAIACIPLRKLIGSALRTLPLELIEKMVSPLFLRKPNPLRAERVHNLGTLLQSDIPELVDRISAFSASERLSAGDRHRLPAATLPTTSKCQYIRAAMQFDLAHYLPDNVLSKVDRATMQVSLESRAPLLDHRIHEFVCRLPTSMLLRGKRQKRILRSVLVRHVPAQLVDRPKLGFSVPLGKWISGGLNEWARDLTTSQAALKVGINVTQLTALLAEHESGRRDHSTALWPALSLIAWAEKAASETGKREPSAKPRL